MDQKISALPLKAVINLADEFLIVDNDGVAQSKRALASALSPNFKITTAETTAGVTPVDFSKEPGIIARYGDVTTANITTVFQNALNASAGTLPIIFQNKGSSYKLTSRVTAPANTTIILENGAEIEWTATAATGPTFLGAASRPGIEIQGNNFKLKGEGILTGPSVAAYVLNEFALFMQGTSTTVRKSGFSIDGKIEFKQWGSTGFTLQFVNDIRCHGFHSHSNGEAGWFLLSCAHGDIYDFECGDITPGTSGNAYGFSLTHDSTNYSANPNPGTKSATHPFCWDFKVHDFTVYDVPLWQGADSHGGYEIEFYSFSVYNCRHGAAIPTSSGAAVNYAGSNNKIHDFYITTTKRDGSATSVTAVDRNGINMNGGSSTPNEAPICHDGVIDGYGDTVVTSNSLSLVKCNAAHVHDIEFRNWRGRGVDTDNGYGHISNLSFGAVNNITNSTCMRLNTATGTDAWHVSGCRHNPDGGLAANEGLRIAAGNSRVQLIGMDFEAATTPYAGVDGTLTAGQSDFSPQISVTGTPTTIDVSVAKRAPHVWVNLNVSGASTITDITGAFIGQRITLYSPTANVSTFDRTNAALAGAANYVSTLHDTLELLTVNTSGIKFIEISRAANS